jgi:hypothetical protein
MAVVEIERDRLTLNWEPPESDGNATIEEYIVERRLASETDKDWKKVAVVEAEGSGVHRLIDDKVIEGKEYYYRVKAVNKAGPGDPCDHNKPAAKIQAQPGTDRANLYRRS